MQGILNAHNNAKIPAGSVDVCSYNHECQRILRGYGGTNQRGPPTNWQRRLPQGDARLRQNYR